MTLSTSQYRDAVNNDASLSHVQKAAMLTDNICFHCGFLIRVNAEDRKAAKASKVFCSLCGNEKNTV